MQGLETGDLPVEKFDALARHVAFSHCFVGRIPGIDVEAEKSEVLERLDRFHRQVRTAQGLGERPFITAEQIHGNQVAVIGPESGDVCAARSDGLITNQAGVSLGIFVADCCAVYLIDPVRRVAGLVHSGKKGTELKITANAIALMSARFGSSPADLVVQLSPCIRPPHYEVDFAAEIVGQCQSAGVTQVYDCGTCTACDLERYYSYRQEKGRTGRMLALLALA